MNIDHAFLELWKLEVKREQLIQELSRIDGQRSDMANSILDRFDYTHSDQWLVVEDRLIVRVDSDQDVRSALDTIKFEFLGLIENADKKDAIAPDPNEPPF